MASAWTSGGNETSPSNPLAPDANQRDITTQLVVSIALGLTAFLTFCVRLTKVPPSIQNHLSLPVLSF